MVSPVLRGGGFSSESNSGRFLSVSSTLQAQ